MGEMDEMYYSELEEGEIVDECDTVEIPQNLPKKDKKLPHRYRLHTCKSLTDRTPKKGKHLVRHHHFKKKKNKTPKNYTKKSSNYKNSSSNLIKKPHVLKTMPSNTDLERYAIPSQKGKYFQSNNFPTKISCGTDKSDVKIVWEKLISKHDKVKVESDSFVNEKSNLAVTAQPNKNDSCGQVDESEDEEELRQIALSSLSKKVNNSYNIENSIESVLIIKENNRIDNKGQTFELADNYEVVDMEVDNDSNVENFNGDKLFVIDTAPIQLSDLSPGSDIKCKDNESNDKNCSVSSIHRQSTEEFEEALLRAELIANMLAKKAELPIKASMPVKPEVFGTMLVKKAELPHQAPMPVKPEVTTLLTEKADQQPDCTLIHAKPGFSAPLLPKKAEQTNPAPILPKPELIATMLATTAKQTNIVPVPAKASVVLPPALNQRKQKPTFRRDQFKTAIYSKSPLIKSANLSLKRAVNNANVSYSKLRSHNKLTNQSSTNVHTSQERLIIALNDDSSTDESDEELSKKATPDKYNEASIEALISNARQKSDLCKSTSKEDSNISCLSKAQQDEYNSLRKILAEKDVISNFTPTSNQTKEDYSNINSLNKKISNATENLIKEVKIMNLAEKELLRKKQIYMSSKLKVQHLKEQMHAAEKVRTLNLESWKKCAAKLDIVKQSVLKGETLINLLKTQLNSTTLKSKLNSNVISSTSGNIT